MATALNSTPSGVNVPGLTKGRRSSPSVDLARLRRRMERTVDRLIDALDTLDAGTEDLEHGGDLEPSLGSVGSTIGVDVFSQLGWARGCRDDRDEECEDEGADIQAVPHDAEPDEPSLGALENPHDQTRWAQGHFGADEAEPEDDLPPAYLPSEQSQANRAAAARADHDLRAILLRLKRASPERQSNAFQLLSGVVLPFPLPLNRGRCVSGNTHMPLARSKRIGYILDHPRGKSDEAHQVQDASSLPYRSHRP